MLDAASYGRVFKKAKRSRDKVFTILSRPNKHAVARLGLAISKKNCKLAVGRNRIKRVVRESFRRHQEELAGIDIVVLNQPETKAASNRTLFESLERHWENVRGMSAPTQEQR